MAKKSIKRNYIYNMIYQVLLLLAPLITTPYISRVLGSYGVGTVSYVESISSYFVLFATMGITTYGQREISYYQDSIIDRSKVFWNTKILEFITSGLAIVAFVVFTFLKGGQWIYIVLTLNIISVFFDITWFYQGLEEFGIIVFRNIVIKILQIVYYFLFVTKPEDIVIYALGLGLFTALGNISLWFRLRKYITRISLKEIHPFENFGVVVSLFVPTIAVQIYTVLDKTMIGKITQDATENGYYEQATKICKIVLTAVTSLGAVMIPRIGHYFKQNNKDGVNSLMYKSYRFVFFLGVPLCFGLIGTANNFVPWFLGEDFMSAIPLIKILSFLIIAIGINNVTGMQYLIPTNRQNIYTKTVIMGASVNFILNILLIYYLKSIGAAIASLSAECVIAIIQLVYIRKEISMKTIAKSGMNYFLAGAVMLVVLLIIENLLTSSIINTLLLTFIGAIIYVTILFVSKDDFFLEEVQAIIQKFKRRFS